MQIFNTGLALKIMHTMGARQKNLSLLSMQLATGNRLVSASVDPAGLAISEKMKTQIRGLRMASRNVQDAISMVQTADGALGSISDMLQRMRELTVQAANDTCTDKDRELIQIEISQLLEEIGDTANKTEFNKKKLLDGLNDKENGGVWIQTGANTGQGTTLYFNKMSLKFLGLEDFDITGKSAEEISKMVDIVDKSISKVSAERARMGAYQNRMEHTINNLENAIENLSAAESRISGTDMAKAMIEYTREQLLMSVSTAMLANLFTHEKNMISILLESLKPGRRF